MKIGIDCRILNNYVKYLLNNLIKRDKHNKYVLFFDSRIKHKKTEKYAKKNVQVKYFPFSQYKKYMHYAYSQLLVSAFLAKERLNIFHAAAGTMPITYPGKKILNLWKLEKKLKDKILQKNICRAAKIIIVPTENFKKRLEKNYKIKPDKIIILKKDIKKILELYKLSVS